MITGNGRIGRRGGRIAIAPKDPTDEAADMLTLPADAANCEGADTPSARAIRKKEWEREDKWTKMAKPTKKSRDGGGMTFDFETRSSKLIERTWKGIPDRWRSTAWYSFLAASAKRHRLTRCPRSPRSRTPRSRLRERSALRPTW